MTPAELSHGAALLAAATPGPWRAGRPNFCCLKHKIPHPGPPECEYTFQGWYDGTEIYRDQQPKHANDDSGLVAGMWDYEQGGIKRTEDAAAIAWLRTHAAELIADAARYQWLREALNCKGNESKADVYIRKPTQDWAAAEQILTPKRLDMRIDAARASAADGGPHENEP